MPLFCRTAIGVLAVALIVRSSVTITWNSHPAAAAAQPLHATVLRVRGALVDLRLDDGKVRSYVAAPDEIEAMRALVGARIAFKVPR